MFPIKRIFCLILALLTMMGECPSWGEEKIAENDWCTITYPEKVIPGEIFKVHVTLKEIPAGLKLGGDLHHARQNAYLGFAAWGGELKPAKQGETVVFQYRMPEFIEENRGAHPIFFLTSKGWDEAEKKAICPVILPWMTEEVRKTIRPQSVTFKKSWLSFGSPKNSSGGEPLWQSGEKIVVPVKYYIDPEDDWGGTQLSLWIVGPWIDCPDGKYTQKRQHMPSHCGVPNISCEIGKRVSTSWTFTLPQAYADAPPEKGKMGDHLLLIAQCKGADKKNWPWQVRQSLPGFVRKDGYLELDTSTPGNLFTYDQPVVMQIIPGEKAENLSPQTLLWEISNTQGKVVLSGKSSFPPKEGGTLELPLSLEERGTFLFRAELPGKETREITFARIPNLHALIGKGSTPFGGQKWGGSEEAVKAARLLGMSVCRVWIRWQDLEPMRGIYSQAAWNRLQRQIDLLNQNHIRPWLLLDGIPPWTITNPTSYGGEFTVLPVQEEDLRRMVTRLSKKFKNDIIGFEWQNEIVPGTVSKDPIADYLHFCRVAHTASKKVNPHFQNQIAGGLWPQTFRQSLIAAGILDFTDILSIHYGNAGAVRGAKRDLASVGADQRVVVWDNETALGSSTWGMPLKEAMLETSQSDYFFRQFPEELLAGCEKIVLFGGEPAPAGDWSHFWGDMSPRPSAAALAVLIHALCDAKPVGEFSVGKNDSLKLFERPNRPPVMVVSSLEKGGETISLPVGKAKLFTIDQQGNRTELQHHGKITLPLSERGYLVEGGDRDILKSHLVLSFPSSTSSTPVFTGIAGQTLEIPLRLTNGLNRSISGELIWDLQTATGNAQNVAFSSLLPGEEKSVHGKISNLSEGITTATLTLKFSDPSLPTITRKVILRAVQSEEIGNLIRNPGFELPGKDSEVAAENWNGSGHQGKRVPCPDTESVGHEKYVYRFENTGGKYFSIYQNISQLPESGGEYLYSFWIRSEDLTTGSNLGGVTAEGKNWNRHWLQVFQAPATQSTWEVFRKRLELPPGTQSLTVAPVCQGKGWTLIDNAQLVPYEGTEYVALAPKAGKIHIDGNLEDFQRSAPVPLIGRNQLRILKPSYPWTPQNMSAVAWFNYDEEFLYAAIEVLDDHHVATRREAECRFNDSIRLGIHPVNRLPGEDAKAFCLDFSATAPGGSGKHTIYRPKEYSGGLKSGSLAKDSSVYDIVVRRVENRTVYEVAIPWSELAGVSGVVGTKIGLSLMLTDCDDQTPEACMLWGEGLYPAWSPTSFGILMLTE